MAVAQQFCRAGGADDAGAYDDNVVGHASGCALLEIDAALQDLERVGAIADAQLFGACQAAQRDLARRRLPGPLDRALPAPVAPGEDRPALRGIERRAAVVADAREQLVAAAPSPGRCRSGLSRTGEAMMVAGRRLTPPWRRRVSPSRRPDARDTRRWRGCRCSARPPAS